MNIGLVQMEVSDDKRQNWATAKKLSNKVRQQGAELIVLPEMFNSPYEAECFSEYAEPIPGPTTDFLSNLARDLKVYLVGGSIPERSQDTIYNTAPIYNPQGELIARHRKIHLFNVNIPGQVVFQESEYLSGGDEPTVVSTTYGSVGVAICYDLRFPELIRTMSLEGAKLVVFPAAFNTTTGPAHWKVLLRSRAIDNQIFIAACSPARNPDSSYRAYGHSMVVQPWGEVIEEAGATEETIVVRLDLDEIGQVREQLPLYDSRRPDKYQLKT